MSLYQISTLGTSRKVQACVANDMSTVRFRRNGDDGYFFASPAAGGCSCPKTRHFRDMTARHPLGIDNGIQHSHL